jgi:hypothetical protein
MQQKTFSTKYETALLHLDSKGLKFLGNVKGIVEKHPRGRFMSLQKHGSRSSI